MILKILKKSDERDRVDMVHHKRSNERDHIGYIQENETDL